MYQRVDVEVLNLPGQIKSNTQINLKLKITNPYTDTITLGNKGQKWKCFLEYGYRVDSKLIEPMAPVTVDLEAKLILPGQSIIIPAVINLPKLPGKYKLEFSIRTEPFIGSRNSSRITVEVAK